MKKVSQKQTMTLEDLAAIVARGFASQDKKFERIDQRFEQVEENFRKVRADILGIGDRYVSKHEFDSFVSRFTLIEDKVNKRSK